MEDWYSQFFKESEKLVLEGEDLFYKSKQSLIKAEGSYEGSFGRPTREPEDNSTIIYYDDEIIIKVLFDKVT
jgi:hypothetical protein